MRSNQKVWAVSGLLGGAFAWGVIWYPLRLLEEAGFSGEVSSFGTFLVPLVLGVVLFPLAGPQWRNGKLLLLGIAIGSGWANLGYVLAVIQGEVMRVLLLFYLAPLWTVLLARWLLSERLDGQGYQVMALSLSGAMVMLWQPESGLPLPKSGAEWLALSAGFMFALANVLSRKAESHDIYLKSLSVWAGVTAVSAIPLIYQPGLLHSVPAFPSGAWWLLAGLGGVMFVVTLAVQYGLSQTPANQAVVIFLFELVVAAVSSYYLANEAMSLREWVGGGMIVAASLFSGKLAEKVG